MPRLLWVTAIGPRFDAGGGGEIRQAHLIDALADRFEISLMQLGPLRDERIRRRVHSVIEVHAQPSQDPRSQLVRRLRDLRWILVQRQSDEVARQRQVRRAFADALTKAAPADVVCVEYVGLAPLLPRQRSGTWVLTLHNLPSEMARHRAQIVTGRRQRAMLSLEARHSRRVEAWAAGTYDLTVTVSGQDARCLGPGVVTVPNGVDLQRFQVTAIPAEPRVMFSGALHTAPNRDGIVWFVREVWPRVRTRVPAATLTIVGAAPPPEVLALGREPQVEVIADVPDVVPYLEAARVAVVPLRIGSGSRLKALEAMAAGRPVVGTRIGLEGLSVEPGSDVLIADQPAALAEATVRCLIDQQLAVSLARRGREAVEQRYSWSEIGAGYARLLEQRALAPAA